MMTDFGEVAVCCVKQAELVVFNGGLDTLELTSAAFQTANGPFELYDSVNGGCSIFSFPFQSTGQMSSRDFWTTSRLTLKAHSIWIH